MRMSRLGGSQQLISSGMAAHWDASVASTITLSGGDVHTWDSLVNSGNYQLRWNTVSAPTQTTVNGKNAINFSSVAMDMWFFDNLGTLYSTHTAMFVMSKVAGDNIIGFGINPGVNGNVATWESGVNGGASVNAVDYATGGANDMRAALTNISANSSQVRCWAVGTGTTDDAASGVWFADGQFASVSNPSGVNTMSFPIGTTTNTALFSRLFNNAGSSTPGRGVACEVLFYNRKLSNPEITQNWHILKQKWGTP